MKEKVDVRNSEQNAFVQDWLSEYFKATDSRAEDLAFNHVLETIQETYNHQDHQARKDHFDERLPDVQVTKVIVDGDGRRVQVDGALLSGRRVWILLHTDNPAFKWGPLPEPKEYPRE
jgi:hypothetical protein